MLYPALSSLPICCTKYTTHSISSKQ